MVSIPIIAKLAGHLEQNSQILLAHTPRLTVQHTNHTTPVVSNFLDLGPLYFSIIAHGSKQLTQSVTAKTMQDLLGLQTTV